jgi:hypothetical protein
MKQKFSYLLMGLFSLTFFGLLLFLVKPELIYHLQQLGFSTSKTFFNELANYPGGMAEYLSVFLFQYTFYPFMGAVVITLILFMITVITAFLLKNYQTAVGGVLLFLPATLIAILLVEYELHPVFPMLVLMLLLFFSIFKAVVRLKMNIGLKTVLLVVLFSFFYYLAGGFTFLVLCMSAIVFMATGHHEKHSITVIFLIVAMALLLPLVAPLIFFITERDAFVRLTPYFCNYKPGNLLYTTLFSLPAIILIQSVFRFRKPLNPDKTPFVRSHSFQVLQSLFMVVVLVAGMTLHIDREKKFKLQVDKMAHNREWDALLKFVEGNNCEDRIIQFHINRALFFTGNFTTKLFDYPQYWGLDGLFLTRYFSDEMLLPSTELFFDLAFVNEAIHYGNEALAQNEHSPIIIEQLILANIASDKLTSAQLYVNVLKEYPIFRKKAEKYERYLSGQGYPEIDDLMVQKRELMPVNDFMVNRQKPSNDLLNILSDKPKNKMAYEYLMACYLLDNDVASFAKHYSIGRSLNYGTVPLIFQQALVLYTYELSRMGKSTGNMRYDKAIVSQFNEYLSILGKHKGNREAAMPELKAKFGNTFWFYIHYNSPVTKNKNQ